MFTLRERTKRKIGIILIMSMLLVTLGTLSVNDIATEHNAGSDSTNGYVNSVLSPHDPIVITHDDNFTQLGFSGSGSEGDPYLIDHLEIFQTTGKCIEINNTRAFFTIDGCHLNGSDTWASIYMFNVTNGRITNNLCEEGIFSILALEVLNTTIKGNSLIGSSIAIKLEDSDLNIVENNLCQPQTDGIRLEQSNNNSIIYNTCEGFRQSGVMLIGGIMNSVSLTQHNVIRDNTIDGPDARWGIRLTYSANQTVIDNRMYSCGLVMEGGCDQTLVKDNLVNGKPSFYSQHESDISIPSNAGEVLLVNCENTTIQGLFINNTSTGISLTDCSNVTICDNDFVDSGIPIEVWDCSNINVFRNYMDNGFMGIRMMSVDEGSVSDNFVSNFHTPVSLSDSGVEVYWNTLYGLHTDASDGDVWNEDTHVSTFDHNFYSKYSGVDEDGDGIGDSSFLVSGDSESVDYYPLMYENTPATWSVEDTVIIEFGQALELSLGVESSAPIIGYSINGANFSFDGEILRNTSYLQKGDYLIHITVENLYGLVLDEWLTIIVEDTLPPDMIESQTFYWEYGTDIYIDLEVSDISGIGSIELNHPTLWINQFVVNETGQLKGRHSPIGNYTLGVTVTDNCGQSTSVELLFIVDDTRPPTFLGYWGNTTLEVGETGNLTFQVFDYNYLDGWYNVTVNGHHRGGGPWWGENITIDVGSIIPGEYTYIITVYDAVGNFESYAVIVRVVDPTQEMILQVAFAGAILSIPTIVILIVVIKRMNVQ